MKLALSPHLLWLVGSIGSLLLWLGASTLQQSGEEAQRQNQQLREATLLVDNAANQLHYALLAGQSATELLLSDHPQNGQNTFQRFAPFILADNALFDFAATVRRVNASEREQYDLQQVVPIREYSQNKLQLASGREQYYPLEQQFPDNSKALPPQLDLASQNSARAALLRVSQSGRPAITLVQVGGNHRLMALFSARGHPGNHFILLGLNPGSLLNDPASSASFFRASLPYRLRISLKAAQKILLLDNQGADAAPPQQPILSSARTIGGQTILFELYPLPDSLGQHNYLPDVMLLLALLGSATFGGLIVRQTQRSMRLQRQRLQAQGSQNSLLQKQIEQQYLQQDEYRQTIHRLRAIVEGSGDAILVIGHDGLIRDLNHAAELMLGQSRDVLLYLPAGALISELHPHEAALGFTHHVTPRIGRPFEALMICNDSQMLQVEVSLTQVAIEEDALYIALCRDISQRKAEEAALIRLKDSLEEQVETQSGQLSALLEASPLAMAYVINREFRLVNQAFLDLFLRSEENTIGHSSRILFDSDEQFQRTGSLVYPPLFNSGEVSHHEFELCCGNGEHRWISLYGKAIKANRPELGSVWLFQDRSAQRAIEDNLRRAKELAEENSRNKTEFLANMSHELRTPMHAILGFAEMGQARVERASTDKLRHYFERIHISGNRLLTLLNDLLDLSKMEVGKMAYNPVLCDIGQIAREAVEELRGMAQQQNIGLRLHIHDAGTPLTATADAFRIGQVLRNLLGNAIKFSPAGTDVEIDIHQHDAANLSLNVRDFGPGIPPDEQEYIFNTFIQGSLTKNGAGGTGLGLAICREIVQAHHGRIEILPVTGQGAHFRVILPRNNNGFNQDIPR